MKKFLSVILTICLVVAMVPMGAFSITASAETSGTTGDCIWSLDETVLTISGNGKMGDGHPWWREDITKVVIEYGVTSIGDNAFSNCADLTSVKIPNSVTSLGDYAFYFCNNITSITIPNSITNIGEYAFYGCTSLKDAYITDIEAWCNIAFGFAANPLYYANNLYLNGELVKDIVIPDSVTKIPTYAFSCNNLESIIIPDSVTNIGAYAFYGCSSLKDVHISDIEAWCDIIFDNDSANPLFIANNLYLNGELIKDIVIPDSVTKIPTYAFSCNNLESIIIPDSVTRICEYAFVDCSSLTSITIPNSVTFIDGAVFKNCSSLTNITIPDSVTSIRYSAFSDCSSLTSITIPDSITFIDGAAFKNCSSLKNIIIPESVELIGGLAFYGCESLQSIAIPNSVTSIAYSLFEECNCLENVQISESIKSIEECAFGGCYNLKNVFYSGSESDRKNINITDDCNNYLLNATWHYNTCAGEHTYSGECDATCNLCEWTRKVETEHNYDNSCDTTCNICGAVRTITHNYKNVWLSNGTSHYHECSVCGYKTDIQEHIFDNACDTTCNICDAVRMITHNYKTEWSSNSATHYHECSICGEKTDVADHDYDNDCDTNCNTCGAVRTITHNYRTEWSSDSTTHYRECSVCSIKKDIANHDYDNACDKICNVCGYERTVGEHVYDDEHDAICNECGYVRVVDWVISAEKTGIYSITPKISINSFKTDDIAVFDKNNKAIKYNAVKGGWPLVKGEEYTLKLSDTADKSKYLGVTWTLNEKANKIFPDTTANEWYNDAVTYAVGSGIMTGYATNGLFGTSDSIQRQDFIVMLARYDGVDLSTYASKGNKFPDVDNTGYYAAAVKWGADKGIIKGYTKGEKAGLFGVGDTITREQLVTMLYRYAKNVLGKDVTVKSNAEQTARNKFNDYSNVSVFSKEAILWATEKAVINGKGVNHDAIDPQGNAQRCEVAQIMYNIFKNNIL